MTPSTKPSNRSSRAALVLSVAAFLLAAIAAGPPVANAARKAANSDKVDGLHAIKAKVAPAKRKQKLVATNKRGFLPNNIIKKAPNADRLDGLDSTAFARRADLAPLARTADLPPAAKVTTFSWSTFGHVPGDNQVHVSRTFGEFTKQEGTALRLDFLSGSWGTDEPDARCHYFVAVAPGDEAPTAPPRTPGHIMVSNLAGVWSAISGSRTVLDLPAGTYTAYLLVRGLGSGGCNEQPGDTNGNLTITEFAVQ